MTTLYDIHWMELELEALRKENAALRRELIDERTLIAELTEMIENNGVVRAVVGENIGGNTWGGAYDY